MGAPGELAGPDGLTLRPWRPGDAPVVLRAFSPLEMARQAGRPVTTTTEALEWVAEREGERAAGTAYAWAVVGDGVPLGHVSVAAVNHVHGIGWVSYWTAEGARRKGVALGGVRVLARWAFDDLGLHRLELGHRTNNPASCAVAVRAGFRPEGVDREKLRYGGVRYDVERHARLATDHVNDG
ncbi:GNAT family N-acetyltransferase [Streptomyces sp. NPDC059446]|uniref:GNAT family N-acetyltransferase n=1 Tax=Streptomyces sp. NPDC059446 TaxID=3346833 RepID=UPI0036C8DB84